MKSEIKVTNSAGVAVVDIEGVIGVPEKMQFDNPGERVATYDKFTRSLAAIKAIETTEVVVNICSTGGDVNDALLIYEALKELDAKVVTRCRGYVASAATIIAQAASEGCREITPNTLYLIHCSESAVEGNANSMSMATSMLEATDTRIASIYAERSGRTAEEYKELMSENGGNGRWLSAEETVAAGLADVICVSSVSPESSKVLNFSDVDATLEMLGLPALPRALAEELRSEELSPSLKKRIAAVWRKIIDALAPNSAEKSDASNPKPLPENRATPKNDVRLESMLSAQDTAKKTVLKDAEDPSPTESATASANQQAYENDVQNLIS